MQIKLDLVDDDYVEVSTSSEDAGQEIETMFELLMRRRGWDKLPDQARQQIMAYSVTKKIALLEQNRLDTQRFKDGTVGKSTNI